MKEIGENERKERQITWREAHAAIQHISRPNAQSSGSCCAAQQKSQRHPQIRQVTGPDVRFDPSPNPLNKESVGVDRAQFAGAVNLPIIHFRFLLPCAATTFIVNSLPIDLGAICKVDPVNHQLIP